MMFWFHTKQKIFELNLHIFMYSMNEKIKLVKDRSKNDRKWVHHIPLDDTIELQFDWNQFFGINKFTANKVNNFDIYGQYKIQ